MRLPLRCLLLPARGASGGVTPHGSAWPAYNLWMEAIRRWQMAKPGWPRSSEHPRTLQRIEANLPCSQRAVDRPARGSALPPLPTGLIVLETTGAKSGQPRRVPLLATVFDGCVFIGTVRGARSLWVRNLVAEPRARYWVAGREYRGLARIFDPGRPLPVTDGLPPFARVRTGS